MSDAFTGGVIRKLGGAVAEQVANEASLVLNFKKDFEWLQSKLEYATGFLQHAHGLNNELTKKWLFHVQGIAYDAEDIVEECAVRSNSYFFRYKMGRRIRELKDRMESIMKDAEHIGLAHNICHFDQPFTREEEWKKSSLIESDAKPVAINAKVEEILNLLGDHALQVIAVVGMGGVGKTFLLQNVYSRVRQKFDLTIWLSISQMYNVPRLQSDIASHLNLKIEVKDVTEPRAAELINEGLNDKRWLIVLDDVWGLQGVHNLLQRLGIPVGTNNACKVVVTTRSREVCMGASKIYPMELLSEKDSWNLFCLHAFSNNQQNGPEINKVAHKVERECGRLPLAIKTVAASMANNKVLSDWENKLRQLKEVSDAQNPIMPILRLSYDALPAVLKPCFLYFSFFGEDEEIDVEELIYLWIGEGFIKEGEEQWSTGLSYLKQLNNLCLVEVSEDRELKRSCKIHDLLRDLIIYISKENKCAFTIREASATGCRRILLAKKGLNTADIKNIRFKCSPSLRSLSFSHNPIKELPIESLSGVRALRVIDLSSTEICKLPKGIEKLKLLRVLNLSNTSFQNVPDCVRNLKSLSYLNVRPCPLPEWIGDLKCLQYLHVGSVHYCPKISKEIVKLISLRTFRSFKNLATFQTSDSWLVLKDVAKFIHLQELSILLANEKEQRSLEEGVLAQLVNMRHLSIFKPSNYGSKVLALPQKMEAMKDLEYLLLRGFTVPRWICQYRNLRVLKLRWCAWSEYPALETMPNLTHLVLNNSEEFRGIYSSEESWDLPESFGNSGAFPQLRYLEIFGFQKLPDLQDGAMPHVKEFKVYGRRKMQNIPEGFEHLRSLELLYFSCNETVSMDKEIETLKEGGEYWNKMKASNPHVNITIV